MRTRYDHRRLLRSLRSVASEGTKVRVDAPLGGTRHEGIVGVVDGYSNDTHYRFRVRFADGSVLLYSHDQIRQGIAAMQNQEPTNAH
jgi:hypothetical protein